MPNEERHAFTIDFIDPLFAVALHIGFTHGIMEELWFRDGRSPESGEWFDLSVFILGLLTVILSWVGYHTSIRLRPIKGSGRFIVDVLLLLCYIVLLAKFKNFGAELFILSIVYILFLLWDFFKVLEYRSEFRTRGKGFVGRYTREIKTFGYGVAFGFVALAHHQRITGDTVLLVVTFIITFFYRIDKKYSVSGRLFGEILKSVTGIEDEQNSA